MPKPNRPELKRAREYGITDEIVVDAYTPEERAIGWHCYLDDKLRFLFKTTCIAARSARASQAG